MNQVITPYDAILNIKKARDCHNNSKSCFTHKKCDECPYRSTEEERKHLAPGIMDWDGHCVFSPDGEFVSSEGYWNKDGYRSWALLRVKDEAVRSLGQFQVPEKYRETYSRCDLHARWRPDGKQLGFNSVHEGSRQVYLRDVKY